MSHFNFKSRTLSLLGVFTLLYILSPISAAAQATFTTDEAEFISNNVLIVQDFEDGNVAPGDFQPCNQPVDSEGDGLCFAPGVIKPGLEIATEVLIGLILAGANVGNSQNPFNTFLSGEILGLNAVFTNGITFAAGVDVGCLNSLGEDFCSGTIRVSAFGEGGAVLGSIDVAATSRFDTFVGVTSTEPITRINVGVVSDDSEFRFPGFDRVSFGRPSISPIPALSEWGLIAMAGVLGIAGVLAARRKKAHFSDNHS